MILRDWLNPPRHVMAIFLVVALVSAGALAVLVRLLFEQERAVETQRKQERLEQAGTRAVTAMQGALADLRAQFENSSGEFSEGVAVVRFRDREIEVRPEGGLLYYPETSVPDSIPDPQLATAERLEFSGSTSSVGSAANAIEAYERLAGKSGPDVRAAAFNGLARLHRREKNFDAALRDYDRIAQLADVRIDGLPSGLLALAGRASVFEERGEQSKLRLEAASLNENLLRGRWRLVQSEYEFYSQLAKNWQGDLKESASKSYDWKEHDAIARTEAFAWLWRNKPWLVQDSAGPASWHLISSGGIPVLTLWNVTPKMSSVLMAGPSYLNSLCEKAFPDPALRCTLTDIEGNAVSGVPSPARPFVSLAAAVTGLPWTLQVSFSSSGEMGPSSQRNLLIWLCAVLIGVWGTGAWFIMRAISRELRVAGLQSDFVAAVSHEFRSPLSSVSQLSEMLATDRIETEDIRKKAYQVMTRETARLRGLVESLLDFGRLEAGGALYHFEPLAIGAFLQELIADFQGRIPPSGYTVELRLPESEITVHADREAVSRALLNLLDNAVKYSPDCRSVWVEVERLDGFAAISVRDRGLGIPAREQSEVFEKFFRGSNAKGLQIKGTGIGLATVRHIVRAHGGEIQLASEPGQGSRFTLTLPEKS